MNLVFDMDGVLASFVAGYEKLFGGHVTLPEIGLTKEQWKKVDATENFWLDLPMLPGAKYLQSLGEIPENYYILTSRGKKAHRATLDWFNDNKIDIPEARIIFANPRYKKAICLEALAPCRFLDDSISNVDLCDTIRGVEATLMLQSYNGACALRYFPSMDVTTSVEKWIEGDYHVKRSNMSDVRAASR